MANGTVQSVTLTQLTILVTPERRTPVATQPLSMSDYIFELNAVGVQSPSHASEEGCTDQRAARLGHQEQFGAMNPFLHGYDQHAVKINVLDTAKNALKNKNKNKQAINNENKNGEQQKELQPIFASNSTNMLIGYREVEVKERDLGASVGTGESGKNRGGSGVFNGASRVAQNFSRRNEDGSQKDSIEVGMAVLANCQNPPTKKSYCRDFQVGKCTRSNCKFLHELQSNSPRQPVVAVREEEQKNSEVKEKKEPERLRHVIIKSSVRDALYQVPMCSFPFVKFSDLQHYDVDVCDEPETFDCRTHGYGWATISSDPFKNTIKASIRPSTSEVTLEGYRWKDENNNWVHQETKTFRVYEPLFVVLNKSFKASKLSESILNAITVHATLDFGQHPILDETREYYKHLIVRRYYASIQSSESQVILASNSESIGKGSEGYVSYMDPEHSLPIEDMYRAWTIEDVECELELTWSVRTDFTVIKHNNIQLQNSTGRRVDFSYDSVADCPYFSFGATRNRTRHRTNFFRLGGIGMPDFVEYANTANNLTHGLKRLLGAKDQEDFLRKNSIRLAAHIARAMAGVYDHLDCKLVLKDLIGSRITGKWANTDKYVQCVLNNANSYWDCKRNRYVQIKDDVSYLIREKVAQQYLAVWSDCNRTRIQKFLDRIKTGGHWCYYRMYEALMENFASCFSRQALTEIQHVKRKLRMRYVQGALLSDDDDHLVDKIEVLIKRELAKFGKAPRVYANYDAGCVYANEIPEFVKVGIDGKHYFVEDSKHGPISMVVNIMSKPKKDSLKEIFNDLFEATKCNNYLYVAIYSDDMCISGCINGKVIAINLDIESNDSSQDAASFQATYGCLANFSKHKAKGLIDQCLKPLFIASPQDPESFVTLKFSGPVEGSGSTLTTILNHIGALLIVLSLLVILSQAETADLFCEVIDEFCRKAAANVGHTVTVDNCSQTGYVNFHHFQFLKRSPFRSNGEWLPYTNLGCILRKFGSIDDDLTYESLGLNNSQFISMSTEARCQMYLSAVVAGWTHEPSNPILRALRSRFGSTVSREVMQKHKHDSLLHIFDVELPTDYSHLDNTDAIMSRYDLSLDEIEELACVISNIKIGQTIRTRAISKIMAVDYGVKLYFDA